MSNKTVTSDLSIIQQMFAPKKPETTLRCKLFGHSYEEEPTSLNVSLGGSSTSVMRKACKRCSHIKYMGNVSISLEDVRTVVNALSEKEPAPKKTTRKKPKTA